MRCALMTFYFAHNYGAVLQAYSLKNYLEHCGHETDIIGFVPEKMIRVYSLNPLTDGLHPKTIVRRCIRFFRRLKQYRLFSLFIKNRLGVKFSYCDTKKCEKAVSDKEIVIFGSDQIWNEDITGEIPIYFAGFQTGVAKKIAYAGSFGRDSLTEYQKECVSKYLYDFAGISVRENSAKELIKNVLKRNDIQVVLDPVFLNTREFWHDLAKQPKAKVNGKYILFYSLNKDAELESRAKTLSRKTGYPVYAIHPTGGFYSSMGKKLYDVGPEEFLWLIENAEVVCTSSFHAVAFSVIFRKKLVFKPFSNKESRARSLLVQVLGKHTPNRSYNEMIDFGSVDYSRLENRIQESKDFLTLHCRGSE